jgi:inorganic pyrophosphatase
VTSSDFWRDLDALVERHRIVVDRPATSLHPTSPRAVYPLDYGYLDGTRSGDGEGVDVWIGSLAERRVVGVACAVDGLKGQVEVKLLLGCSPSEIGSIQAFFSQQLQMGCRVWLREPELL